MISWQRTTNLDFSYAEFAPDFTAEFYEPDKWADLFKKSGAKYVVLTSKHHEGYTLWPSRSSWNWNAMDVGPKQDLVAKLANSTRAAGLKFGLYHSLFEWFNPTFQDDKDNNWATQDFVDVSNYGSMKWPLTNVLDLQQKTMPELYEIVNRYKPEVIWSDGDWDVNYTYWKSTQFLSWLYNDSPVRETVVTNDRWGKGSACKHGDFITCQDRYNPGQLQHKKWENCMTLDKNSWGYVRRASLQDYLTIDELILTLVQTIAYGGNLLVNVGPTADGRIIPIFEERLTQMGQWLSLNGEAVYGSHPWSSGQNDSLTHDVYFTQSRDNQSVYAIFIKWPEKNQLELGSVKGNDGLKIELIVPGGKRELSYEAKSDRIVVTLGQYPPDTNWGWVLQMNGTLDTMDNTIPSI